MTAEIGRLWEEGVALADSGNYHGAILQYQRAKFLLIAESKKAFVPEAG
jgi:hypothetical protein